MSTIQDYMITVDKVKRLRARIAMELRRAELAQARAAESARIYERMLAFARERGIEMKRDLASASDMLGEADRLAARLGSLSAEERQEMASLRSLLSVNTQRVQELRAEMGQNFEALSALAKAEAGLENALTHDLETAAQALGSLERLSLASTEAFLALARQAGDVRTVAAEIGGLEGRIESMELELKLAALHPQAIPTLLLTSAAMAENGYVLKQAPSEGDLVAYFEKLGSQHQIAVRFAPVKSNLAHEERWQLLAETFRMEGDSCLHEITALQDALEALEMGEVEPGTVSVYPKPPGSGVMIRQASPEPQKNTSLTHRKKVETE